MARVSRFRVLLDRYPERFLQRFLHADEIEELHSKPASQRAAYAASRWACKEAAFKSLGGADVPLFPHMKVAVPEMQGLRRHQRVLLTLSHEEDEFAVAVAASIAAE